MTLPDTQYRIFEFRDAPDERNLDLLIDVIKHFDFPWRWVLRETVRDTLGTTIAVEFEEQKQGTRATYDPMRNRVNIGPVPPTGSESDLVTLGRTFAHELSHLVDDATLTHATRAAIHELMHDGSPVGLDHCVSEGYWRKGDRHSDRPIEAFGNLGPHIWCPKYAKPHVATNYGPHYFRHLDRIKEMVMSDAEANPPFTDVVGNPHEEAILWAAENGLVGGFKDGTFKPGEPVTRGQLASILHRQSKQQAQ